MASSAAIFACVRNSRPTFRALVPDAQDADQLPLRAVGADDRACRRLAARRARGRSIIILPRNDPHRLASEPGVPPADVEQVSWITPKRGFTASLAARRATRPKSGAGSWAPMSPATTRSFEALPPMLTLNVERPGAHWLEISLQFLSAGKASPELVARLAELFLATGDPRVYRAASAELEGMAARADRSRSVEGLVGHSQSLCRGSGRRVTGAEAGVSRVAWRALYRASGRIADALLRAMADAHGVQLAARRPAEHGQCGLCRGL